MLAQCEEPRRRDVLDSNIHKKIFIKIKRASNPDSCLISFYFIRDEMRCANKKEKIENR